MNVVSDVMTMLVVVGSLWAYFDHAITKTMGIGLPTGEDLLRSYRPCCHGGRGHGGRRPITGGGKKFSGDRE